MHQIFLVNNLPAYFIENMGSQHDLPQLFSSFKHSFTNLKSLIHSSGLRQIGILTELFMQFIHSFNKFYWTSMNTFQVLCQVLSMVVKKKKKKAEMVPTLREHHMGGEIDTIDRCLQIPFLFPQALFPQLFQHILHFQEFHWFCPRQHENNLCLAQ